MALVEAVAVLAVRNEEVYLGNALRHLKANGVKFAVIDNQSDDDTQSIIQSSEFSSDLVEARNVPFEGKFDLKRLLREKMALIEKLHADWVIHMDADEIMHPMIPGLTLQEAISLVDRDGCNAIAFSEFVFLPVKQTYLKDHEGFQPITSYYYYSPRAPRLMRAWKRSAGLSMVNGAGHTLEGPSIHLASEKMALRHYLFCNQEHAFRKYATRRFKSEELAEGWHWNRHQQPVHLFKFPSAELLQELDQTASRELRMDDPRKTHYWHWSEARLAF